MNDPYKPPESDVWVSTTPSKLKWKLLFWFMLILEASSIVFMVLDPDETILFLVLDIFIYFFILVGLFGFAYSKRIFARQIWTIVIPVGLAFDIYAVYDMEWSYSSTEELYFIVGFTAVIGLPLWIFQYLALFKYRFQSSEIWT